MSGKAVALYLRLSKEDEDKKLQSESINNQRDFLMDYAEKMNFKKYEIFVDDGFSGTNFERPGFKKLINQIETGKIDTVVTKDLSRLGRDYIQTGYYLEKYFPSMGVRFIAVNDGIDTGMEDNGNNEISPFKSVINDMYARDISKKVRTALMTKKKNGRFIGSFAPFGYKKDILDKGHLLIDETTALVVSKIFRLYLEGNSLLGIAKILTEEKIPTPSQSKQQPYMKHSKGLWSDVIVKRILTNQTYTGDLVQNRTRKINYKLNKKINLKKESWIITPNTHEGIISKEDFEAVQRILSTKNYVRRNGLKTQHFLSGLVFCGDCGAPMTYIKESEKRTYLVCSAWKKYGGMKFCTSHSIREGIVIEAVLDSLKGIISKTDMEVIIEKAVYEMNVKEKELLEELGKLEEKLVKSENVQYSAYKDKVSGILSEEQFLNISDKITKEISDLERQKECLQISIKNKINRVQNKSKIRKFLELENIERNYLMLLIKRINIFQNKNLEIIFNFKDPNNDK